MTAVICWSMKMRIIASSAGGNAAKKHHQGFLANGFTTQPRCVAFVGCNTTTTTSVTNHHNNNQFISIAVKPLRRTASTYIYRTSVGTQDKTTNHNQYRHTGQVTTGFSTGKKLPHAALSGWKQPHQAYNRIGIHQMAPAEHTSINRHTTHLSTPEG